MTLGSIKSHEYWSRRRFISAIAAASSARVLADVLAPATNSALAAELHLRDLAAQKGLIYGCSATPDRLSADPQFAQLVAEQCGILVPENSLNWRYVEPRPGGFDFHMGDWLMSFAKAHNMKFGGGALVWNQALSAWLTDVPIDTARKVMLNHVSQIVSHYQGRAFSWAVVNEATAFRGAGTDLKDTPFLRMVGPDYIEASFRAASESDPGALLIYNENHLEYDIPEDDYRRATVLKLLKGYLAKKVPIGALGIQSHLGTGGIPFSSSKLKDFLNRVSDLGLKIAVSELDVTEKGSETEVLDRDRAVANEIQRYLDVVLQNKSVISVVTWGLTARYSWLASYAPRSDGRQIRPLPYDTDLRPTQAWQALAAAFDHAPRR